MARWDVQPRTGGGQRDATECSGRMQSVNAYGTVAPSDTLAEQDLL